MSLLEKKQLFLRQQNRFLKVHRGKNSREQRFLPNFFIQGAWDYRRDSYHVYHFEGPVCHPDEGRNTQETRQSKSTKLPELTNLRSLKSNNLRSLKK
ncbi:hypothetical protein D3C86_1020810 [compost metagenome]